ncbi:MAG TPA: SDR family oxidoreductase [Candidatus Thioglobus sp.]|nr:SDR family oxidoreductase [Candidatus Thioglobus sp.]HIL78983.1 SDR family oxidoreductase [Methylococcales bacterium]
MSLVKPSILVTGGTGFVGQALINHLLIDGYHIVAAVRSKKSLLGLDVEKVNIKTISATTDWKVALKGIDVVIHCAARVHIMNDSVLDPLAEFRKVNTVGTFSLARQAAGAGIKRFVFISSIKVNGEMTAEHQPFTSEDSFMPEDPYGLSKYEAEQGLLAIAKETGMEVVIIRPPLVYASGVKANFALMIKWINKGVPLPLGAIHNQRSLVALENLVSFISHCIDHPKAANEVFLISDGEDVSTSELLRKVAKAFGKQSLLIPVPVWLMTLVAKLMGKADMADRLFGSLQVDSSKARDLLGWKPMITMDKQLKKVADAYLNEKGI